jgi:hypothetical protein
MKTLQSTNEVGDGKEKAPRRTGLFPKSLSTSSSASGYDSLRCATTTTTRIYLEGVNRNRYNFLNIRFAPPVSHHSHLSFSREKRTYSLSGAGGYYKGSGAGGYLVGSALVLASYSRCPAPLNVSKDTCRACAEPARPTLRSRELRGRLTPVLRTFAPTTARLSLELALPIVVVTSDYGIDALTHADGGLRQ